MTTTRAALMSIIIYTTALIIAVADPSAALGALHAVATTVHAVASVVTR